MIRMSAGRVSLATCAILVVFQTTVHAQSIRQSRAVDATEGELFDSYLIGNEEPQSCSQHIANSGEQCGCRSCCKRRCIERMLPSCRPSECVSPTVPEIQPPLFEAPPSAFAPTQGQALLTARSRAPNMFGDNFGGTAGSTAILLPNVQVGGTNLILAPFPYEDVTFDMFARVQGGPPFFAADDIPTPLDGFQPSYPDLVQLDDTASVVVDDGPFVAIRNPDTSTFQTRRRIVLNIPSPSGGGGGLVGRLKIAENSSPMPRDRIFFNYSFFDNVPLTTGGVNVNRFTPGFEKTFFGGRASFEMRFPFASTLDSDMLHDPVEMSSLTNTSEVLFGDITMYLKSLLYTTDTVAVSGGLGISVPTADDVQLNLTDGTEVLAIENEAVHLTPFLGALYTPNDRLFAQGFLQVDVDANGNAVLVNTTGDGLQHVGTANDVTFLYVDVGAGYWIYRSDSASSHLTGFAPTFELHLNRSLQDTDVVTADVGGSQTWQIGSFQDDIAVLNMMIGGTFEFGENRSLSVGYVTPLGGGADQQFDGELRVFFNWRFGAQDRRTRTPL